MSSLSIALSINFNNRPAEERLLKLIDKAIDKEDLGNMGAILFVETGGYNMVVEGPAAQGRTDSHLRA